jgi:hypothetical protein
MPNVSSHPEGRTLNPLIGLETGSIRMARKIMAGKSLPFEAEHWPSVVINGLTIFNRNNWIPVMTLIIGAPGETDEDVQETLDLLFEIERRGLHVILVPSVFTPLKDTRMENMVGVQETIQLSKMQWQLMMSCWKISASIALQSWWGPFAWSAGAFLFWALRGRRVNGPNFTWPAMYFSRVLPRSLTTRLGGLYRGKPLKILSHAELLDTVASKWKPYFADAPNNKANAAVQ